MSNLSKLSELCKIFDVSLSWALGKRLEYLNSCLVEIGDSIQSLLERKDNCIDEVDRMLTERQLHRERKAYRSMEYKIGYWKNPKEKISDEDIERAREYPIKELLNIEKRGNISCPFHDDKHPSASIKDNKLHCFTCGETWGSIDVVMKRDNMGFMEAVKFLCGG